MEKEKQKRDSRYELLRIIAMFMVVASHCVQHSGNNNWDIIYRPFSFNLIIAMFIGMWGQVGVALFIIQSSFFLCDQNGIHMKKVVMIILRTWGICIFLIGIFFLAGNDISFEIVMKELITPLYRGQYNFITTYLFFYISMPVLQTIILHVNNDSLRKICIIYTFLVPCLNLVIPLFSGGFVEFVYLFFLTTYLKRTDFRLIRYNVTRILALLTGGLITGMLIFNYIGNMCGDEGMMKFMNRLFSLNILTVFIAVCIFYLMKNSRLIASKYINYIAKATLGVYIWHENYLFRGDDEIYGGGGITPLGKNIRYE